MNLKKLERYLRVNLLGPGPRLIKKDLLGRGLTRVEKHCCRAEQVTDDNMVHVHCMLDTKGYKCTHIQVGYYSSLFHCKNGCKNAPQCYVIRTLPCWTIECLARKACRFSCLNTKSCVWLYESQLMSVTLVIEMWKTRNSNLRIDKTFETDQCDELSGKFCS